MTRFFDVYVTIDGTEEKILENYPAEGESHAKKAGRTWLRMYGRTPAKRKPSKTDRERSPLRAVEVPSTPT